MENDIKNGFWVFAYGSLLWKPGFEPAETVLATLSGFRRSFCMSSIVYRGTPEAPGLVLALDAVERATCTGLCYRVGADSASAVLDYIRKRELVSAAYQECWHPVQLSDGRSERAVCYVMDREHDQYNGALSLQDQARIIARAHGSAGPNRDYLINTVAALRSLGLSDPDLFDLENLVAAEKRP